MVLEALGWVAIIENNRCQSCAGPKAHRAGSRAQTTDHEKLPSQSPVEFHSELHGARVRLYVGDLSKLAAKLVDLIHRSIRQGWQAPVQIRNSQVLVVKGVIYLPANIEITGIGKVEILAE